jgi:hypothetical protein
VDGISGARLRGKCGRSASRVGAIRWETWVHHAEIKIPAGIDVALVCAEGIALFDRAAADAEAAGQYQTAALLQGAAKNLDSGQQVRIGSRWC